MKNDSSSRSINNHTQKKVAIFHCGFIYSGGGERIVLEEARGLVRRGWHVEVYGPTINPKKCYPQILKELNVKTFLPSYFDSMPLRNALRMIVTSILAPVLALWFRHIDIFIGANQPGAWMAYCMSTLLNKPYIVYLNQPARLLYPRPVDRQFGWFTTEKDYQFLYKLFRFIRPAISILDRKSTSKGFAIMVNGSYIGGVIENIYGIKTIDNPAGATTQPLKNIASGWRQKKNSTRFVLNGKQIDMPYALITNRHDPQKRFDYVIKAMLQVIKQVPKATLVIPGPFTQYTPQLVQMTKDLKIDDRVVFTGQIREDELQQLYKYAQVYCYPSEQEDFGLGPLEAGGWAVPTVAWNVAGPTVTVEDGVTGFLVEPYDVNKYAQAMIELFTNKQRRLRMGKAAWERTHTQFSWDKHLDIVESELNKALIKKTDLSV